MCNWATKPQDWIMSYGQWLLPLKVWERLKAERLYHFIVFLMHMCLWSALWALYVYIQYVHSVCECVCVCAANLSSLAMPLLPRSSSSICSLWLKPKGNLTLPSTVEALLPTCLLGCLMAGRECWNCCPGTPRTTKMPQPRVSAEFWKR